jgi:hypothetical protein
MYVCMYKAGPALSASQQHETMAVLIVVEENKMGAVASYLSVPSIRAPWTNTGEALLVVCTLNDGM